MAEGTGRKIPVNTYDDRDMLKAVIQERKMDNAAAGGGVDKDFERYGLPYQQQRYYTPTTPTLPAPAGYIPGTPTYWQSPSNIVYAFSQVIANPQLQTQEWAGYASQAFSYLQQLPQNSGKDPSLWTWAGETDPIMQGMAQYAPPPPEFQYTAPPPGSSDLLYQSIYPITPEPSAVTQAATGNVALPEWQQWYETFASNPYAQAALQALPVFVTSALIGGAAGGPVGALLAGGASIIAMGMMQQGVQNNYFTEILGDKIGGGVNTLWEGFMRLNAIPAEWTESLGGTASYLAAALQEEDIKAGTGTGLFPKYPGVDQETVEAIRSGKLDLSVPRTAEEWKALWNASRLFYEVESAEGGIAGSLANVFPAVERITDALGWTDPKTVPTLAGYGEVLTLGKPQPTPITEQFMGLAALNYARNEILKGVKSPDEVVWETRSIYGVSGEFADLILQSILDPTWTVIPAAVKGSIKGIGILTKNKYLVAAADMAHFTEGAIGTARHYQDLLRGAPVSDLSKFQMRVAGIDIATGALKQLTPGYRVLRSLGTFAESPLSPVAWFAALRDLAPASRMHFMTDVAVRNLVEMFNRAEMDVVDATPTHMKYQAELAKALHGSAVGDQARYGALYDTTEWYAIRQWLSGAETDFKKKIDIFNSGKDNIDMLLRAAEAAEMKPQEVIDLLRTAGDDRQFMFNKLTEAIGAGRLDMIVDDPRFNADNLAKMMEWVDKNAWSPEMLKVELYDMMMNKMGEWAIENYGIKKLSGFYKIMGDMKAVGSLLLLGFNPRYMIKNIEDGVIGMASQGVYGLHRVKTAIDFMEKNRLMPARLTTGVGMGEITIRADVPGVSKWYDAVQNSLSKLEVSLRQAQMGDEKGVGAALSSFISKVNKFGPFTQLSARMETMQRASLYYVGYQKALPRMVELNYVGMDNLPGLRQALVDAKLEPKAIEAQVRAAMLKGDGAELSKVLNGIDPKVWDSPEAWIDTVAAKVGLPVDKVMEVLNADGTLDNIKARIEQGQSAAEAIDGVRLDIEKAIGKKAAANLIDISHDLEARVRTSGWSEALDTFKELIALKFEQHGINDMAYEEGFQRANEAETPAEHSAIVRTTMARVRASWKTFNKQQIANFVGILKALGADVPTDHTMWTPEVASVMRAWIDLNGDWNKFYELQDEKVQKALNKGAKKGDLIWAEIREDMAIEYPKFAQRELGFIDLMRDSMMSLFSRQFPGIDTEPIRIFWDNVKETAQKRQSLVTEWRNLKNGGRVDDITDPRLRAMVQAGLTEGARLNDMWPAFWTQHYMPVIGEGYLKQGDAYTAHTKAIETGQPEAPRVAAEGEVTPPTDIPRLPNGQPLPEWLINFQSTRAAEAIDTLRTEKDAQALIAEHSENTGEAKKMSPAGERVYLKNKRAKLVRQMKEAFGYDDAQVSANMAIMDARARVWSKATGNSEAEWYARIKSIEKATPEYEAQLREERGIPQTTKLAGEYDLSLDDGRAIIRAFSSADIATLPHELAHIFRRDLGDSSPDDLTLIEKWAGVEEGKWTEEAEEKFAKAFERYLAEGDAPSKGLAKAFGQFKDWLVEIYRGLRNYFPNINDEIRGVFDRMLAVDANEQEMKLDRGEPVEVSKAADVDPWADTVTEMIQSNYNKIVGAIESGNMEGVVRQMDSAMPEVKQLVLDNFPEMRMRLAEITSLNNKIMNADMKRLPQELQDELGYLLFNLKGLVEAGEPGRREIINDPDAPGVIVRATSSSYPEWYADLAKLSYYDTNGKVVRGKAAVLNAFDDILAGTLRKRTSLIGSIMGLALEELQQSNVYRRIVGFDLDIFKESKEIHYQIRQKQYDIASEEVQKLIERAFEYYDGDPPNDLMERILWLDDEIKSKQSGEGEQLFQTRPDGTPEPTADALRGIPETGTYVRKLPRPLSYRNEIITGMAFHNGEFAAWITHNFEQMKAQPTAQGDIRLLGVDLLDNWVFVDTDGKLIKRPMTVDGEIPATGPFAPKTLDAQGSVRMPYDEAYQDGYWNYLAPTLNALRESMGGVRPVGGDLRGMDANGMRLLKQWEGQQQDALSSARLHALRAAESNGDMAILNYQRRTKADQFVSAFLPYQFWYSRSMLKWALYAVDRPGMLAFYSRLMKFMSEHSDEQTQYPTRLKGNMGMALPWLPDWAGGSGYFDPLNEFFPMHNFIRPYQMLEGMESRLVRDAKYNVLTMFNRGEITFEQAQQAIEGREGTLWDKALDKAKMESGTGNMIDYISLFQSPILPLQALWNKTIDRTPLDQLPMSRFFQGLSGVTGWKWPAMLDIQAHWNKSKGISEFGDWGNYYIDRTLSNMAAENPGMTEQVVQAMLEHTGPLYEQAVQRVQYEQGLSSGLGGIAGISAFAQGQVSAGEMADAILFGWLPFKLFPEGEMLQRGLKDEWDAAVMAQREGNPDAVEEFFDAHPEYRARLALFDEPEERLRWFLVDQIWGGYYELSALDRRKAVEQLGPQFEYAFMNKGTRDYFGVSMETMAGWANFFKGTVPDVIEPQQMSPLQQVAPNVSALYDQYYQQRNAIAGGDYSTLNDEYWSLTTRSEKNAFLAQHPELGLAWDLKEDFLSQYPFMQEYITNAEYGERVQNAWSVIQELGTAGDYLRQYYTGKEMPSGVREYLYHYWKTHGRPKGDFNKWIEGMRYMFEY